MADSETVYFPETVFMLGSRYDYLSETVREFDRDRHLSLRNILDATPPVWIRLTPFNIGRKMVTNGEYLQFLDYAEPAGDQNVRLYDLPDIWRYIWATLNMRVERCRVPFERAPGEIIEVDEDYSDAQGFIEGYLSSLRFEILRLLPTSEGAPAPQSSPDDSSHFVTGRDGGRTGRIQVPRELASVVTRVFVITKYLMRRALLHDGEEMYQILTEKELKELESGYYDQPSKVVADLQTLIDTLRKAYQRRIDKRYRMPFQHGHFPIEPVQFLTRLLTEVRKLDQRADVAAEQRIHIPLCWRDILYPRYWPSKTGDTSKTDFMGQQVPWAEQPVYGLTLYEALAYCAWRSKMAGRRIELPNEAQYERASSWPIEALPKDEEFVLDPTRKLAFPWADHNPTKDFNSYFGREGMELANYYFKNKRAYNQLMEETARMIDDKNKVYQLEGFGWQWSCDRYNDDERKYIRFEDFAYPRYDAVTCREKGNEAGRLTIFDYQPVSHVNRANFVLKGSPDIIGGPGITTRRFAANPMRAYPNVGFRIVVPEE